MKIVVDGKVIMEAAFLKNSLESDSAFFTAYNVEYTGGYPVSVSTQVVETEGTMIGAKIRAIKAAKLVFKIGLAEAKHFVEAGGIVKNRMAYEYQWVCSFLQGVTVTCKEIPNENSEE